MKKITSIRKTLATLLTICLVVTTFGFYNSNTTQAETQEAEKILLQSDQNWNIYRYKYTEDSDRILFDITYNGLTIDQLYSMGYSLTTILYVKDMDSTPYTIVRIYYSSPNFIKMPKEYNLNDLLIRVELADNEYNLISTSNFLSYYGDDLYMLYWDLGEGYEYEVWRYSDEAKIDINIKFSEQLEGDISAIAYSDNNEVNSFLKENQIENISYQNYSEEKIIDENTYTIDYSVVTFSVNIKDYVYGTKDGHELIKYIIDFNNVVSSKGKKVKPLVFSLATPTLYDPNCEETTTENSTEKTTTVKPTTEIPTTQKVEPTTIQKVEPITQKVELTTTQKVEPTTVQTTTTAKKYVTKFKIIGKKSVKIGKKLKLKVSLTPKKATYQKIKWSVNKKKYAEINQKGVLTPKKAGKGKTVIVKVTITNTKKRIKGAKNTLTKTFKVKIKN